MTRARPVQIETCCVIPAGTKPRKDNGKLRPWIRECLVQLNGAKRAVVNGPTGSGKSTAAKCRGAIALARNPKLKHIVSVPQGVIAASFTALEDEFDIRWPGVGKLKWRPSERLINRPGTVDALVRFIERPAATALSGRILVCTHQALVAAFRRLQDQGKLAALKNVMLTIDEVHHAQAEDEALENRLGGVVKHYFDHNLHLDAFTATLMRTNYADIIPAKYVPGRDYAKYVLAVDKHLESMEYLREVAIRFIIGTPEDSLRHLFRESTCKTIAYIPPVQSEITSRYGDKYTLLDTLRRTLGPECSPDDPLRRHRVGKAVLSTLDLVTEDGREARKEWLTDTIRENPKAAPALLWALNMCKEGFDWPAAERGVVMGPRGSMLDTIQMLGRLLRDHKGKRRAEFNIVLPYKAGAEDPNQIRQYLKVMLASMVVEWQFRQPSIRMTPKEKKVIDKAFVQDPTIGLRATAACVDAGINANEDDNAIEATRREFDKAGLPLTPDEKDVLAPVMVRMVSAKSLVGADAIPFEPELVRDVYGCVRSYGMKFGYRTLTELREALGKQPPLTADIILADCDAFHTLHGGWPQGHDTHPIPGKPNENWRGYQNALSIGLRGLPGGSSLPRLLEERRGVRNKGSLSPLTVDGILAAADKFFNLHGEWPKPTDSRPVPGEPKESWQGFNVALSHGYRGLPQGSSLPRLLDEHRGVRNRLQLPELTEVGILADADAFHDMHGEWPSAGEKRPVPGKPGETWTAYDLALRRGARGLASGSSLSRLLARERGQHNPQGQPQLTEAIILADADKFFAIHGEWPRTHDNRPVPDKPNETWMCYHSALYRGIRGLKAGGSLARLLAMHRDARIHTLLPKLTEADILTDADNFHALHGRWPKGDESEPVPGKPQETWANYRSALHQGARGLPGGSSLARLLAGHRGVRNHLMQPALSEAGIVADADKFFAIHGKWPTRSDKRAVPDKLNESWSGYHQALKAGVRGLVGGASLARLLFEQRGVVRGRTHGGDGGLSAGSSGDQRCTSAPDEVVAAGSQAVGRQVQGGGAPRHHHRPVQGRVRRKAARRPAVLDPVRRDGRRR